MALDRCGIVHESRQRHGARADYRIGVIRAKFKSAGAAHGGQDFRHFRADCGADCRVVVRVVVCVWAGTTRGACVGGCGFGAADRMPVRVGLATPLSVTVSTGRAAQMGVLIRSAEALETCGKINAVRA